jgi:hypothetical protein
MKVAGLKLTGGCFMPPLPTLGIHSAMNELESSSRNRRAKDFGMPIEGGSNG